MKKITACLTVLCLAVALLVTSLAWFSNNMKVDSTETLAEAGKDISTSVVFQRIEDGKYNGETGRGSLGDEDAPYSVLFSLFVRNNTNGKPCRFYINMDKLIITRGDPTVPPYLVEEDSPGAEFTWRFRYNGAQYKPNAEGYAVGVTSGEYLQVPDGNIYFEFDLIYLSEDRYLQWQYDAVESQKEYDALHLDPDLTPYLAWVKLQSKYFRYADFLYSAPTNMGTTFYFDIKLGIAQTGGAE